VKFEASGTLTTEIKTTTYRLSYNTI